MVNSDYYHFLFYFAQVKERMAKPGEMNPFGEDGKKYFRVLKQPVDVNLVEALESLGYSYMRYNYVDTLTEDEQRAVYN